MYRYPDYDDKNLHENVMNKDWEDTGLEARYIQESIDKTLLDNRNNLLDAGCGQGRLFPLFKSLFKNIVAIDPDPLRLASAKEVSIKSISNIHFMNTRIQDLRLSNAFDFIVCSHVIQHVHTHDLEPILDSLWKMMMPHAFLILSTTNWPNDADLFEIRNTLDNSFCIVSEEEFNNCVKADDRRLPTRLFSEKTLITLLSAAKFNIIFLKKYHGFPKIRGDNFVLANKQSD